MENFTSQSVKRRIMWHVDYRGHSTLPDLERAVTELTVIQRDVQAILPLAMVSGEAAAGLVDACVCHGCLCVTNMCPAERAYGSVHVYAGACAQVCDCLLNPGVPVSGGVGGCAHARARTHWKQAALCAWY